MAASSRNVTVDSGTSESWPKWKLGLAIGVPAVAVAIGGVWLYKRNQRKKRRSSSSLNLNTSNSSISPSTSPSKDQTTPGASNAGYEKELTPLDQAQGEKNKGNKYFKGGRYDQAIECYSRAIETCPQDHHTELSTFYQNRAAAHEKLKNLKMVVSDTTKAIEYNKKYVKALSRRAAACEQLGDLTQSLEDVTALCLLEGFQNPSSLQTADRVLKKLGQTKATETFQKRKPAIPSKHFIRTYFKAFINDPVLSAVRNMSDSKLVSNGTVTEATNEEEIIDKQNEEQLTNDISETSPYLQALRCLRDEKYEDIISLCTEELDDRTSQHQKEALLLRATFYLLMNQYEVAEADLSQIITSEAVDTRLKSNAYIKRGSIWIQQGKHIEGLDDFATAVRGDPENADIYHHRGHHNIQLDNIQDALRDLENAISKSPSFAAPHVQKSFAEHKRCAVQMATMNMPLPQSVIQSYKENVDMFPDNGDAHALYAQALGDAGKLEEADVEFKKALELDPDNATAHVHRGLLHMQSNQNIQEALEMINTALDIDSRCEYAYEVLGTINIQQGNTDKASDYFEKAILYSRTESEMAHLFSLLEASKAQMIVAKNLGIQLPTMGGMGM